MIIAVSEVQASDTTGPQGACLTKRISNVIRQATIPDSGWGCAELELLAIHRQANATGWGAGSCLAVADWLERHRPHKEELIDLWHRLAGGLGVAL